MAMDPSASEPLPLPSPEKHIKAETFQQKRKAKLGEKQRRQHLRSELPEGFYISVTGKKRHIIFYLFDACYMLPTLDFDAHEHVAR